MFADLRIGKVDKVFSLFRGVLVRVLVVRGRFFGRGVV